MAGAGAEAPAGDSRGMGELVALAAALAGSVALAWLLTGDSLLALSFAAGLVVLGLAAFIAVRARPRASDELPGVAIDWSAALAALEAAGLAVAITDRANRLVCASSLYQDHFGTAAPPRLGLREDALDLLAHIARTAWREGRCEEGAFEEDAFQEGWRSWTVSARTAGPAEDHLVWLFTPLRDAVPADPLEQQLAGTLGRMLGRAGIAAALVGPEGTIRAANSAFARAAAGAEGAELAGAAFTDQLRADEHQRLFFAREGRAGAPQVLVEVPLAEAASANEAVETGKPASLMLLFERGIGHGWENEGGSSAPQLEGLIERLPLGLAAVGRDGRFLYANPAFRRAIGIGSTGRLPPFPSDLAVPGDKIALTDAVRRSAHGPAASDDLTIRLTTNPEEPVSLGLTGVRGLGEVALLLSLADTTEENRLKRQVAQATKMQAVGQLAGGVAHDFNNVLTAIIGTCDLMLERHQPGDADHHDIEQIKANSDRAASLTRQLLAFSRQQTLKPEIIQLPDVLGGMMHLLERLLGARIELKVHHERDLGPVRADPRQLEQVIMNLAVNARDAIQQRGGGEQASGTLSFTTSSMDAAAIRRLGNDVIPAGDYTLLRVEDTGGGIPRRVLPKIFEPFFTTKEQGKGTGLGLSTVYGIVKQSGGFIFADNVQEQDGTVRGARFTIFLPVYAASAAELARMRQASAPPAEAPREWAGGGRILLVEDEDMVRSIAERALARAGHEVVTARDGEEGLAAFRTGEGRFDMVVSDVVMPGIDGPAMARALREEAPDLPVLFMSGYAEGQLREEIGFGGAHFIAKPFSVRDIADKVGEVLAERARM